MSRTVDETLAAARSRLAVAAFGPSTREAALLLGRVLGRTEAQLLTHGGDPVPAEAAEGFAELLERRLTGEPVAYLLGVREFYGRDFEIDRRVLIPRPETEHIVEAALGLDLPAAPRVLDVGTGSGCLAVTLALEIPGARVVAVDISPGALAVAKRNVTRHRVGEQVRLAGSDLGSALDLARFDLVVSNPPYIDRADAGEISHEVLDFEPELALFPPGGGGAALARLIDAGERMRPGAEMLLEIGRGQLPEIERAASASALHLAATWNDYSSIPRVVRLRRPG